MRRGLHLAALCGPACFITLLACGGDGSTAPGGTSSAPRFSVVAGGGTTDTVQAHLVQALIVEIRDSTGRVARGRTVRFETLPPDDPKRKSESAIAVSTLNANFYTTFGADVTDSAGRAKTLIGFGTVAGTARVRVTVPEFAMVDTVAFTVKPGAPAKFIIGTRDTLVQPGATYALNAVVVDRLTNPVPSETPTFSAGAGIASVSATGQVVAGNGIARAQILVSWKTLTDTARVSVLPRLQLVGVHAAVTRAVVLVNTDGTGYTELATTSDQSVSPHSVSASSAVVYYQGNPDYNSTIWIVKPGSAPQPLISQLNGFQAASWPRWSPDGQWVYFVGGRQYPSNHGVFRIRADGTQLDSLGSASQASTYAAPSISPDGATVALEDPAGIKLLTVATKASRVISGTCTGPRYSPDGTRFACLRSGLLSIMNVDGTGARVLKPSGTAGIGLDDLSNADWSPDGKWLVVANFAGQQFLINATDATAIPLSTLTTGYQQMSFVR